MKEEERRRKSELGNGEWPVVSKSSAATRGLAGI